jgi:hypothetical protein
LAGITLFPQQESRASGSLLARLEISPESLAEMWNELPIEDARIAELTRINATTSDKCPQIGRERLARRLKGFI